MAYVIKCLTPLKRDKRPVVHRKAYGWSGLRRLQDGIRRVRVWPPHHAGRI